jgi:soluble lytic murein transglycosylase
MAATVAAALGVGLAFLPGPSSPAPEAFEPLRPPADAVAATAPVASPEPLPVDAWSSTFRRGGAEGRWQSLDEVLDRIALADPAGYVEARLSYLHGRVALEIGGLDEARQSFQAFLAPRDPFRELAMYWLAELEERVGNTSRASAWRTAWLLEYPENERFRQVLDREIELRQRAGDGAASLFDLIELLGPATTGVLRRELDALLVGVFAEQGDLEAATVLGLRLLRAQSGDDAAERTAVALDRPDVVEALGGAEKRLLGETLRSHRHFDRAVALLREARVDLPRERSELDFSIGRALFFAERYEEALATYLHGATEAAERSATVRFLYHASRSALLLGRDEEALEIMHRALAAGGSGRSGAAVLETRLRLSLKRGDPRGAEADLERLRKEYGGEPIHGQAALAVASYRIGAGETAEGLAVLRSIPKRAMDRYAEAEAGYWQARALEGTDPAAAVDRHLEVLLAPVRSHFAYFSRDRLCGEALRPAVERRLGEAETRVEEAMAAGDLRAARRAANEILALGEERLGKSLLSGIYRRDEAYGRTLGLRPLPWPAFPLPEGASRAESLLAMGLFDDARDDVADLYSLTEPRETLTRSIALSRGDRPLAAIRAAEILVDRVPADYRFEMLPRTLKQQLYPRPFRDRVTAEARALGADPRLLLAIMREESRFDARAKSAAAARGLMQLVIMTAREVGYPLGFATLEARDLYQPAVSVRLGAGYLGRLLERFERDRVAAVAAYNAGPNQAALWARLAPAPEADVYLTNVSFEETKHYVRKVLNSYERYREVWEDGETVPVKMTGGR